MSTIHNYLSSDHRHCDESLAAVESAVAKSKWEDAEILTNTFASEMHRHFNCEENILFPAFEETTGMTGGPTMIMKMEHLQMKEMLAQLITSVKAKNLDRILGTTETLMIYIQQHNGKEEQMLYNMCDMHLSHQANSLIEEMKKITI